MAQALNPAQEWALTVPLKFSGMPTPKDGLSPSAFLRELTNRKTKHAWTDAQVMPYLESSLDKEAEQWFNSRVKPRTREFADPTQAPARNFDAFTVMFKQHYLLGGKTYRPNWSMILHQQQNEATSSFLSRSFNALHTWLEANKGELSPTVPAANMVAAITPQFTPALLHGITPNNNDERLAPLIAEVAAAAEARHLVQQALLIEEMHATLYDFLGKAMLFDGLKNADQRRLAHRLLEEEKPITDVIDLVHSFSLRTSSNAHMHNIDAIPDGADDSNAVGAAGTASRGRGRGRGGRGKRGNAAPGGRSDAAASACTFCGAKAHQTKDCPQRAQCLRFAPQIAAEMARSKKNVAAADTAAPPAAQPLMAHPVPAPDHPWAAQPGNAAGWQ